jgi:hypothetical protein
LAARLFPNDKFFVQRECLKSTLIRLPGGGQLCREAIEDADHPNDGFFLYFRRLPTLWGSSPMKGFVFSRER